MEKRIGEIALEGGGIVFAGHGHGTSTAGDVREVESVLDEETLEVAAAGGGGDEVAEVVIAICAGVEGAAYFFEIERFANQPRRGDGDIGGVVVGDEHGLGTIAEHARGPAGGKAVGGAEVIEDWEARVVGIEDRVRRGRRGGVEGLCKLASEDDVADHFAEASGGRIVAFTRHSGRACGGRRDRL
jgi:hypothetical protein